MFDTPQQIDNAIADPKIYANEQRFHELFARLRHDDPVHWTQPEGYRPFWTVTKYADVMEIERQNDKFLNAPRLTMQTLVEEDAVMKHTGGNPLLLRTLVNMDNPDHRLMRGLTQAWFMPASVQKLQERVKAIAVEFVDLMESKGGRADFFNDVAALYPLRVIMLILGIPLEDEPLMLRMTQEIFGSTDPEMKREGVAQETSLIATVQTLSEYFLKLAAEKRKNPTDDLATVIANAQIDGKPLGDWETVSYFIIAATAGHDTTSSSTAGGLLALIQNPEQFAKLKANPALMPGAIEEILRWVTPVKNFFRTATEDYVLNGKQIKAGDSLLMCYWSANRDETVFTDPFKFDIERSPNRHIAFGYGAHVCLGQHLAKLEMRGLYNELFARLESIELAGETACTEANFVSGLKRFPVKFQMRKKAA